MGDEVQVLETGATLATGPDSKEWEYGLLRSEAVPFVLPSPIHSRPQFPSIPAVSIGSLPDDRLRLRRPLQASIRMEQAGYVACNVLLGEYGCGKDAFEAVDDLREVVCELYWSLDEDEDRLSAHLSGILGKLRNCIEAI